MPPSHPFLDDSGSLNFTPILVEAIPIAKLVLLVGAIALVPLTVALFLGPRSSIAALFVVLGQFVLAVGAGVVLVYVVSRANQMAARGDGA
ncbi:MAG: hypothetical protein V5A23_05110 [Halobacteriales archaeon]